MEDKSSIGIDEESGIATAETVNFFNDLFDSVNGSENSDNNLRCAVTADSVHHAFWTNAKNVLSNMCYVDKITRETIRASPTLKNWLSTVEGFENLWEILKCKYDFTTFKTRYCNQDPVENFFGQMRSHAVRNTNPTPRQFEDSFITLLVTNMKSVKIVGGNCETDEDSLMLHSLEQYLDFMLEPELQNAEVCDFSENSDDEEPLEFEQVDARDDSCNAFILDSDNIISALTKRFNNCKECDSSLRNCNFFSTYSKQILYRILKLLRTRCHQRNILKMLLQHFENWTINMDWHECIEHRTNMFITMVCVIAVKILKWWCNKTNKSMRNAGDDNIYFLSCKEMNDIKKARETYRIDKCKRRTLLNTYQLSVRKRINK